MIASMGAFALADTLVKYSTQSISPAQVLFYLISGALVLFALIAILQQDRLIDARALSPILLLRYLAEIAGMAGRSWRGCIPERARWLATLVLYCYRFYWRVVDCATRCY